MTKLFLKKSHAPDFNGRGYIWFVNRKGNYYAWEPVGLINSSMLVDLKTTVIGSFAAIDAKEIILSSFGDSSMFSFYIIKGIEIISWRER